jgi:hypothetical protein
VFIPQIHVPSEQGQSDFTDMRELELITAGELFMYLLYHFVLTYSNWELVSICPSMTLFLAQMLHGKLNVLLQLRQ